VRAILHSVVLGLLFAGPAAGGVEAPRLSDPHAPLRPLAYASRVADGRHLLAYDTRGDGRVVEVLGDLARADHVAVVVPGSGHRLDDFWTSTAPMSPRRTGLRLLAEVERQFPTLHAAVVVWLGYDTPENVDLVAARSDRAVTGAADLAGLTRILPPGVGITLIGHSYGSVVAGRAAATARADDIVLLGSPGVDVATAADLHTAATVWAATADSDPIRFVPSVRLAGLGHGADPTAASFGARRFATGGISGHDDYYLPGSTSLANLARIVAGRPDLVTDDGAVRAPATATERSR
jgi:Alpha/beta hydrolase